MAFRGIALFDPDRVLVSAERLCFRIDLNGVVVMATDDDEDEQEADVTCRFRPPEADPVGDCFSSDKSTVPHRLVSCDATELSADGGRSVVRDTSVSDPAERRRDSLS